MEPIDLANWGGLVDLGTAGELRQTLVGALAIALLSLQLPAMAILLSRLLRGPRRLPPLQPGTSSPEHLGSVSIVLPTLNEAERIGPCLAGLSSQGYEVREILVVDSHSQDGTPDLVKAADQRDPRFRLLNDPPLPLDWIGRPWALHRGFLQSSEASQWILGIDADTQPAPGLVAGLVAQAKVEGYDLVSLAPQFILKSLGEWWLQPALLITLLYRFGPAGERDANPERVMANGQCFLIRRSLLTNLGGYTRARRSFCDDVTLARYAAAQGAKVGFLDGSKVLKVRMYTGVGETWREWGRSLDLKDASPPAQVWADLGFLVVTQALPLPVLLLLLGLQVGSSPAIAALGVNGLLLIIRFGLLAAIAPSYDFSASRSTWSFWLSPLADPLAVLRIGLSSLQRPTRWRGRSYPAS